MGWSSVSLSFPHPVTEGVKPGRDFYLVQRFSLQTERFRERLGTSEYGVPFTSIGARHNVGSFPLHPYKSQASDLVLIENFWLGDGRC